MDEATSTLDLQNEALCMQRIIDEEIALLTIAHRPSVVRVSFSFGAILFTRPYLSHGGLKSFRSKQSFSIREYAAALVAGRSASTS